MVKPKPKAVMGRIIKHKKGVGFKITFPSKEEANKYKDMFKWIIADDGYRIDNDTGYFDDKEMI